MKKGIYRILIVLAVLVFSLGMLSTGVSYTGTGFTHSIPDNYYDSFSPQDILGKYDDTYLTSEERSVCTKVVDGDTIYLDNGKKVRLVGVNTPEKGVAGYQASKNFVKKLCLNKEVGINRDDKKYTDKYGRTLAVVIVDGKNLNEMLLKEGLAEVMYIPPSEFNPYNWQGDSSSVVNHVDTNTGSSYAGLDDGNSNSANSNLQSDKSNNKVSISGSYIGNKNSFKFHSSVCDEVKKMSEKNKVYFSSRQDAINSGYVGCKKCKP